MARGIRRFIVAVAVTGSSWLPLNRDALVAWCPFGDGCFDCYLLGGYCGTCFYYDPCGRCWYGECWAWDETIQDDVLYHFWWY